MGRWIVIILASILVTGILVTVFPTLHTIAFNVAEHGVKWGILVGCGVTYFFHRISK